MFLCTKRYVDYFQVQLFVPSEDSTLDQGYKAGEFSLLNVRHSRSGGPVPRSKDGCCFHFVGAARETISMETAAAVLIASPKNNRLSVRK